MSKKIWRLVDIDPDKSHFLQLCQDTNGVRYFDIGIEDAGFTLNPECFFVTSRIDNDLLALRASGLQVISKVYDLADGSPFFLDVHNVWLTEAEHEQLSRRVPHSEIVWSTPEPPRFPPK